MLLVVLLVVCPVLAQAQDQMVTYVAENYREQQSESGFKNRIYHALQVDSRSGSKLLILTGDDYDYRSWLREYLATRDQLLLVIPDGDDELFRKSKAYALDVTLVHPVFGERWKAPDPGLTVTPPFKGQKHVLVADPDPKRRELVSMIVTHMGYPVSATGSVEEALKLFRMQPDKYRMVIADAFLPGVSGVDLVRRVIVDSPGMPVILASGYNNKLEQQVLVEAFAGSDNVRVVPLVLRELSQNINRLLNRNV
ncbi:MAG: response regulator [Pseudomonadota bacterium]